MQRFTYLLIDFFTVIVCFVASFDTRIQFSKYFKTYLLSSTIVAIPFIAWDIWFTHKGVWWFNTDYTIGLILAGLPIEECLFFYCIPFSCVFTYYCLEIFFDLRWTQKMNTSIVIITVLICSITAFLHSDKIYTFVTALSTIFTLLFLQFIAKKVWIGQASFTYLILMLGFIPVNGILTGTGIESPIVNYNPKDFLGIRILTIPIEDAVYGYSQFLMQIFFFKWVKGRIS